MPHRKLFLVLFLFAAIAGCFVTCVQQSSGNYPRGPVYAGAETCIQCHKNIVEDYAHSNHFKTSSPAILDSLKKLLAAAKKTVTYPNGRLVKVEEESGHLIQSELENDNKVLSESIDMVFGSGEKAKTFGYWKNEQLFQLPLTYLSEFNLWTNSPGFPIDHPYFTRPIVSRCFECHSSYVYHYNENTKPLEITEKFKANTIVYGIDCERCHGPAKKHVDFHKANPNEKKANFMVSISSLNRSQQTDLCATCHSGNPVSLQSIFAFVPGDSIGKFYMYYPGSFTRPDAHGMQLQSLMQSKCYTQSTLTCITCHNSHTSEDNMQETFTAKCMSCHQQSKHSNQMKEEKKYCVTCHMPKEASKSLDFNNSEKNGSILYKLRTHRIAIYAQDAWQ